MFMDDLSRRDFLSLAVAGAAGMAALTLPKTKILHAGDTAASDGTSVDTSKILSYNPDMEYRRCGKTDWMVSAISLGGHWKRLEQLVSPESRDGTHWMGVNRDAEDFQKNRYDIVTRCIERGINYVDACCSDEVIAYSRALKGRRDAMYLGYSWYEEEMRFDEWRHTEKLKEGMCHGLKEAKQEYVDLWRITMLEQSSMHTDAEVDEMMRALEWAKQEGLARAVGFSSHDRTHILKMLERYPFIDIVVTPYTAGTKVVTDESGLWSHLKKNDLGWFGIKPFASNSIFKGNSMVDSEFAREDSRTARLTLRAILCNPAITAPIPGLITEAQVDNAAMAILERRQLDENELAELTAITEYGIRNLSSHHEFLRNWEYV